MKDFIKKHSKLLIIIITLVVISIILILGYLCIKVLSSEKTYTEQAILTDDTFVGISEGEVDNSTSSDENIINYSNEKQSPIYIIYKGEEKAFKMLHSEDVTVARIIDCIGKIIGYTIRYNSIEIGEKNGIMIDFKENGAPFDISVHLETNDKAYEIYEQTDIAKCIFDSIKRTVNANFGENKKIYYSVNGQDIEISGMEKIDKDKAY